MSKKSKKKKANAKKKTRAEAAVAFLGGVLAHAFTRLVDDAVDVAADRLAALQKRSHKALKKAHKRDRERELSVTNGKAVAS